MLYSDIKQLYIRLSRSLSSFVYPLLPHALSVSLPIYIRQTCTSIVSLLILLFLFNIISMMRLDCLRCYIASCFCLNYFEFVCLFRDCCSFVVVVVVNVVDFVAVDVYNLFLFLDHVSIIVINT